jgi:hypothetical protein
MGKKWKKKLKQRQNRDVEFDNFEDNFAVDKRVTHQKDVHSRLGWKKPNNLSKHQKKKQKKLQKTIALGGVDVDMGLGLEISQKNR